MMSRNSSKRRSRSPRGHGRLRLVLVVTHETTARHFVVRLAEHLATTLDCDVTIIANSLELLESQNPGSHIRFVSVPMERDPHPWRDVKSLVLLTREIHRISPECVMFATPKASLLSSIASFVTRVPVRVYQVWGLRLETTSGLRRTVFSGFERLTSTLATHVLANSHSLAERFTELGLNGRHGVTVLGMGSSHGVDTAKFSNTAVSTGAENHVDTETMSFLEQGHGVVLGFVGRLHPDKGIDLLIEALRICLSRGHDIRLIVLGAAEGFDIAAAINKAGVDSAVHLCGVRTPTQPYYAMMDLLVLPSLREGFPNVVLEAAAMGLPAIVSDATGIRDSVVDSQTGLIFHAGDAQALADALMALTSDGDLRRTMGSQARAHVEENFSEDLVWQHFGDFVSELTVSKPSWKQTGEI